MEIAWTLLYFAGTVIGHLILVRVPFPADRVTKFGLVATFVGAGLCIHLSTTGSWTIETIAALVIFVFASEFYAFSFTLVGASISVRLLLLLRSGKRTEEEIEHTNRAEEMVTRRLTRLQSVGLVERSDGRFRVTRQGRFLVYAFRSLRWLLGDPGKDERKEGRCGERPGHGRSGIRRLRACPEAPASGTSRDGV